MLQMTKHINADWKPHVASTGVTCYTCHRGNPVPQNIWFDEALPPHAGGFAQAAIGKNTPSPVVGSASLPNDIFKPFLEEAHNIRVAGTTALPENPQATIKQTEWTYGLMVHISESLGVNCTYCHNSRSFSDWSQSTPARGTAWYGIRMVRNLNVDYLDPLTSTFPAARLGPHGDGPKVNCLTCHQGVYKPLFGVSMLGDYPELADNK
jgi:photosynthetic reaction center cytochrome c subunit